MLQHEKLNRYLIPLLEIICDVDRQCKFGEKDYYFFLIPISKHLRFILNRHLLNSKLKSKITSLEI